MSNEEMILWMLWIQGGAQFLLLCVLVLAVLRTGKGPVIRQPNEEEKPGTLGKVKDKILGKETPEQNTQTREKERSEAGEVEG